MPQPTYTTDGGYNTYASYSGVIGPDVLITSGPGRLNQILQHTQMQSGQAVVFYDSVVVASGGPIAASGHIVVGVLPPTYGAGFVSGSVGPAFPGGVFQMDFPFRSGLCMSTRSGQPGVSVSYTKEANSY